MAFPTIRYSESGGVDANASGAGPDTVVSGTNGDISFTTLTLNETVDFTGVSDDGSDAVFFEGNAGDRHLFAISSFNPSIAACTSLTLAAPATAPRTAKVWGVGGKRMTLTADPTRTDVADTFAGWSMEFESGNYPCVDNGAHMFTPPVGNFTDGLLSLSAAPGAATRPVLSWTSDFRLFSLVTRPIRLSGLEMVNNTSVSTIARAVSVSLGGHASVDNCKLDAPRAVHSGDGRTVLIDCDISSSASDGILIATNSHLAVIGGTIHDCAMNGINQQSATNQGTLLVSRARLLNNAQNGILVKSDVNNERAMIVDHSLFADNGESGIHFNGTPLTTSGPNSITGSLFAFNGAMGIESDATLNLITHTSGNAYYGNTSGQRKRVQPGIGDVTLSADPFNDRASGDYSINNATGGGADLKTAAPGHGDWNIGSEQGVRRRMMHA